MNWSNNNEVSLYLQELCNKLKCKPTYLPIELDRSAVDLLNKVGDSPTIILDDVREGTDITDSLYQVETSTIIFFVLQDTSVGESKDYNPILQNCKIIAKNIISRILVENEDNEAMQVMKSEIEDVKELNGSLYGSYVKLEIRGDLLIYDENAWLD
jgi:hypothetical protein